MEKQPIKRSERFVMHYQLMLLRESLSLLIQTKSDVGAGIFQLLNKLRNDTLELTHGRCVQSLPELDPVGPLSEWLVYVNNLYAISSAFLTPEEHEEASKFGFTV